MKKKILSLVLAICLIFPCVLLLSSCKEVKPFLMHFNLNDPTATFSEEYAEKNNLSANSRLAKYLNENYFEGAERSLLTANDLSAPDGKAFAGWYLDEDCSPGNDFNKYTFEKHFNDDHTNMTLYAKWVDAGTKVLIFDLIDSSRGSTCGSTCDFTQEFRTKTTFLNKSLEFVITESTDLDSLLNSFPTKNDLIIDPDFSFGGWYYGDRQMLTQEALELIKSSNEVTTRVHARWNSRPVLVLKYSLLELGKSFNKDAVDALDLNFTYENTYEIKTELYLDELGSKFNSLNLNKSVISPTPDLPIIKWVTNRNNLDFTESNIEAIISLLEMDLINYAEDEQIEYLTLSPVFQSAE